MPVCHKEGSVRSSWNNVCLIILQVNEKSPYTFLFFLSLSFIIITLFHMKYNITCHNASIDSLDIYVENEFQSIL